MPSTRVLFAATILALSSLARAQSSDSISSPLISSERRLEAEDDVASVPIYTNFDQKIGTARKGSTQYTEIGPYIPYRINSDYSWVLHPQVTYQTFDNFDGYSSSGFKPTIIQSFFTRTGQSRLQNSFGFGPMVQIRTNMPWMYGSPQNGVGYSLYGIHRTENWVMGASAYQSFGVGATPTVGATANNIFIQPFVTYITKKYGNITLDSESIINISTGSRSYPINLMGSKIIEIGDMPLLFTLGVRYYAVNTNLGGAQGWGGRIGLTYAFSR